VICSSCGLPAVELWVCARHKPEADLLVLEGYLLGILDTCVTLRTLYPRRYGGGKAQGWQERLGYCFFCEGDREA